MADPSESAPGPANTALGGGAVVPPVDPAADPNATVADPAADPDAQAAGGAPDAYAAFTLPEGFSVSDEQLAEFNPIAKELNLTQDQAQKLVDFEATRLGQFANAQSQQWDAVEAEWKGQLDADMEIGGTKQAEALQVAARAVNHLGGQGLRDALNMTRAGNHPEIVRAFYRMGKSMSEDNFDGTGGAPVERPTRSAADILYGSNSA